MVTLDGDVPGLAQKRLAGVPTDSERHMEECAARYVFGFDRGIDHTDVWY